MKTFKIPYVLKAVAYVEAYDEEEAKREFEDGLSYEEIIDTSEVEDCNWDTDDVEEVDDSYYLRQVYKEN